MSEEKDREEAAAGKRVDEEWKKQVQQEKRHLAEQDRAAQTQRRRAGSQAGPQAGPAGPLPKPSFAQFISGLATQVLISLGEVENPMTGRREADLAQAQHTIDLLQLLQEKTKGNLTPQEDNFLTNVLHDLRLRYVRAAGSEAPTTAGPTSAPPTE